LTIIDISEFYDTTVKIERPISAGKSPSGVDKGALTIVFETLLCTIQIDDNKLIMPLAGQTLIDYRILFCDLVDIRARDIITILTAPSGVNIGAKYLVGPVNDFSTADMDHLEISIQGGVL